MHNYTSLFLYRHVIHCRVEKAEASLKDDGEVAKLEDECNWFRGETERLQSNRTTMLKDIKVRSLNISGHSNCNM